MALKATSFGNNVQGINRAITQSNHRHELTSLTLDSITNASDGDAFARAVGRLLRFRSSSLKSLVFEASLTEAGFVAIGNALQQYPCTSLHTLELSDRDSVVREEGDRNIYSIVLSEGAVALARGLQTNTVPFLGTVN